VKYFVIWLFIVQFATGHNLMAELCQMPNLLRHFEVHKQYSPDLTLSQFLWLHYGTNHDESDRNQCAHVVFAESTIPQAFLLESPASLPLTISSVKICVTDEFLRLSAPNSGVFRPPLS
jgi:hypothetical protein